jgi:hypothetical protein
MQPQGNATHARLITNCQKVFAKRLWPSKTSSKTTSAKPFKTTFVVNVIKATILTFKMYANRKILSVKISPDKMETALNATTDII